MSVNVAGTYRMVLADCEQVLKVNCVRVRCAGGEHMEKPSSSDGAALEERTHLVEVKLYLFGYKLSCLIRAVGFGAYFPLFYLFCLTESLCAFRRMHLRELKGGRWIRRSGGRRAPPAPLARASVWTTVWR